MPRARLAREPKLLCHYCGVRSGTTTDHIVPRAFGGPDARWNFVPCCPQDNSEKASKWPDHPGCEVCAYATARFLSDDDKREKAMSILAARSADLQAGVSAQLKALRKLRKSQNDINALYASMANFKAPELVDPKYVDFTDLVLEALVIE